MRTSQGVVQNPFHLKDPACNLNHLILQMSSELAGCHSDDICEVIHRGVDAFGRLQQAEQAGWFKLQEKGKLLALCPPFHTLLDEHFILQAGLREFPWCLAQLRAGRVAVIDETAKGLPAMKADLKSLKNSHIRSLAILPSNAGDLGRTALILISGKSEVHWSEGILEQGTLLANILANAEQRLSAQREAHGSQVSFEQLFTRINCPMALLDRAGRFLSANITFAHALGYEDGELKTMKYIDIVEPNGRFRVAASLKLAYRNPKSRIHDEQTLVRKDLTRLSTDMTLLPLEKRGLGGAHSILTIEHLARVDNDKSELRERELEIQRLSSELIRSQETERRRLSRELHDDIGQRLSLAASEVALLASQQDRTFSSDHLASIRDELDSLCSDLHCMSHNLHSFKLQHLGLKPAMKDLCRQFQNTDFRVDLRIDEFDEPVNEDVALCLYRVAQEALNNALKHSRADTAAVVLTKLEDMFYMTVQDTRIGFQQDAVLEGLGLISMSERLRLLGGELRVHTSPGHGTEIWVTLPAVSGAYMRKPQAL